MHFRPGTYYDPYLVSKKISDVDYVISTPDRWKTCQVCHVNMLKPYKEKALAQDQCVHPMITVALETRPSNEEVPLENDMAGSCVKLKNSTCYKAVYLDST